jgi:hypothetical protein
METGEIAFNAVYTSLSSARAKIRVNKRDVIEQALSSGIGLASQEDDHGTFNVADVTVRCLASAETAAVKLNKGDVVEVMHVPSGVWVPLRISSRKDQAGIIVLQFETPHE